MFRTDDVSNYNTIKLKIETAHNIVNLGHISYISTGAEIHGKEKRDKDGNLISGHSKFDVLYDEPNTNYKPYIEGASIPKSRSGRYSFPIVKKYLDYDQERMRSPKFPELFESPKIMIRGSS